MPHPILPPPALPGRPQPVLGRAGRGFTLLELLVVVILVGILLAMSIPAIGGLMRDRRTYQAAHEAALLYQRGRAMAMGRGGAVLVRYTVAPGRGRVQLREAVSLTAGQCPNLPATSCNMTNWNDGDQNNRLVAEFDPTKIPAYENVQLDFRQGIGNTIQNDFDICFSPLGRASFRAATMGPFVPLTQVPYIQSVPRDGIGRTRTVLIVPTGVTRVSI